MGHANDDYKDPVSAISGPPVPPEVFPGELAKQLAAERGQELPEAEVEGPETVEESEAATAESESRSASAPSGRGSF